MGGSVSAGKTNDELIDHLVEAEFIKTPLIQRVFRAVDRGDYYVPMQRQNAYRDIAWRNGNLHLSAPCVYSVVMEALKLKAGLSFLNLGSGSGYLSTMAGLVLGTYGINHGIELYSDIVEFAYERLEEFLKNANAVDEYDFCEPIFTVGNCLSLDSACQQYDRVYCGASCPTEYESYIKNLVKVGGILIMPLNEKLLKITRTSETRWHTVKVLSVSFAPLIAPSVDKEPIEHIKLGDFGPPKLQHICRTHIRSILKDNIDKEHPNLKLKQLKKEIRPRRQVRRLVIPFYDESDSSNSQSNSDLEYESDGPEYTISSRLPSRMSAFLEDFLRRHAELQLLKEMEEQSQALQSNSQNNSNSDTESETRSRQSETRSRRSETRSRQSETRSRQSETRSKQSETRSKQSETRSRQSETRSKQSETRSKQSETRSKQSETRSKQSETRSRQAETRSRRGGSSTAPTRPTKNDKKSDNKMNTRERSSGNELFSLIAVSNVRQANSSDESSNFNNPPSQNTRSRKKKVLKRKHSDVDKSVGSRNSSKSQKSSQSSNPRQKKVKHTSATVVWKKVVDVKKKESVNQAKEGTSADGENYSDFMASKIGALPLPSVLLRYLNYKRENL